MAQYGAVVWSELKTYIIPVTVREYEDYKINVHLNLLRTKTLQNIQ